MRLAVSLHSVPVFFLGSLAFFGSTGPVLAQPTHVQPGYQFNSPINLGPHINTGGAENTAELSPNGLELIFTSTRAGSLGQSDFWVATRESLDGAWGIPTNPGAPLNSSALDLSPEFSQDGLTLYFDSGRSGSQAQDLWSATRDSFDSAWHAPVNLGRDVNLRGVDIVPSITSDGLSLIFTDGDPFFFEIPPARKGLGGVDLWISTRASISDPWGPPENFGEPVNSRFDEGAADISRDGRMLIFTSDRPGGQGGPDLWMSVRDTADGPWGEPFNLGPEANSPQIDWVPRFSPDGQSIYFGSYRAGGQGGEDIWRIDLGPGLDCNGDGLIDLNDANCATAETIDQVLAAAGLTKGDADGDKQVQFSDFLLLSTNFGQAGQYTDGDFDKNGTVEFGDFLILSSNFGQVASGPVAVPEPSSVLLLTLGGLLLGSSRRRRCGGVPCTVAAKREPR